MRLKALLVLALVATALLLGVVSAQGARVGARVAPGVRVDLPEMETTAGEMVRRGVPTVVVFGQVRDCPLCAGLGDITKSWVERYPNVQVVVVETRSLKRYVEEFGEEFGVPIVFDGYGQFREAFDTNITHVYLLDQTGTVRDKMRPLYSQQWLAMDRQLARANAGDWDAVDANSVALPPLGEAARSSPSVAIGTGTPVVVLVGDGYCLFCRELVAGKLQTELNELVKQLPGLRVYVLEPSMESLSAGFYSKPTHDFASRSLLEEFVDTFGESAAGTEIMKFLETGEQDYPLANLVWPDSGWEEGITLIRYDIGSSDDPVIAWGYGEKESPGMLIFGSDGEYLGPTPFFMGNTARSLASKVRSSLSD